MSRLLPVLDLVTGKDRVIVIRAWLRRLFDITRPIGAMATKLSVLRDYFDSDASTPILVKWLDYNLSQIWIATSNSVWPNFLVTLSLGLGLALDQGARRSMQSSGRHSNKSNRLDYLADLIPLFEGTSPDRFARAVSALRTLIRLETIVPANILLGYVELLTQELLFNDWKSRKGAQLGFSGLLMPTSWANALIKRRKNHNPTINTPWQQYFDDVHSFSQSLQFRSPDRWSFGDQKVEPDMVQALNMRLCWCIALVVVNFGPNSNIGLAGFQFLQRITDEQSPNAMAVAPDKGFATLTSRPSCLEALCETMAPECMAVISIAQLESKVSGSSRAFSWGRGGHYSGAKYRVISYSLTETLSIMTSTGFLSDTKQVRTQAALVICAARRAYLIRHRRVASLTSGMEKRCHRAFTVLGLSNVRAKSRARLCIARGPLLAIRVALEWLAEEMRRLVTKYRSSGQFSMIHEPGFLFAQRIDHLTQGLLAQLSSNLHLHEDTLGLSDIVTKANRLFDEVTEKDLLAGNSALQDVDSWLRVCSSPAM